MLTPHKHKRTANIRKALKDPTTPDRLLAWVEVWFIVTFAIWTTTGMIHYWIATRGTLVGLLSMLDSNWKGVLILVAILFFRTFKLVLQNMKFKSPFGDLDLSQTEKGSPTTYEDPSLPVSSESTSSPKP